MWKSGLTVLLFVVMTTPSIHSTPSQTSCTDESGYNCQFETNPIELSDVHVKFDRPLPPWLQGTLVRNGVGMFERGRQSVTHIYDGFAKLSSWKFLTNGTTTFSTRFLASKFYRESAYMDKIAPFTLMAPTDPPFNAIERGLMLLNGVDNMNVNIWDFPDKDGNTPRFAVMSDFWPIYEISARDLTTIRRIKPVVPGKSSITHLELMSPAHPLPEPGTKNRINFVVRQSVLPSGGTNYLDIVRMNSISERALIAEWPTKKPVSYMHSFSVTQTKVVLLTAPFTTAMDCMMHKHYPITCMDWDPTKLSHLYITDLKTGHKMNITMTSTIFSLHHINAYDVNPNEIVVDVAAYSSPELVTKLFMLDVIRDQRKRNSNYEAPTNKRIHIFLNNQTARVQNMSSRHGKDGLDMPTINENYRSKQYCYVYGLASPHDGENVTSVAVLKKNMCKGGVVEGFFYKEWHYPTEPFFVADPAGKTEDDGILLVVNMRGEDKITYMAVLNATTMKTISAADMPTFIPFSFHGRFFPEY